MQRRMKERALKRRRGEWRSVRRETQRRLSVRRRVAEAERERAGGECRARGAGHESAERDIDRGRDSTCVERSGAYLEKKNYRSTCRDSGALAAAATQAYWDHSL